MDVKTLCLGVLSAGDCSGYGIKKTIEERFHHFFRASYGSIYPALADLEREDLVAAREVEQDKRPDKKVYRITPAGRDELARRLLAEEPRHVVRSEFLVLMYFAHLLPPERAAAVLDSMIAQMEQTMWTDLAALEAAAEPLTPGQRFALGYGRTVLSAALGYIKRQRAGVLRELAETDETGRPRLDPDHMLAAGE
jgi:PadR family transcriptional regulator, regulatory protein AphA